MDMLIEAKRDFLHSIFSATLNPIFYYIFLLDSIQRVIDNDNEVFNPKIVLYIWLLEVVKVLTVNKCLPISYYVLDWKNDDEFSSANKNYRLPFITRRDGNFASSKLGILANKTIHLVHGLLNFVLGIALCHVMFILFGAPLIQKWKLTLGFSSILVSWLYFPLTLVINPSTVLQELLYISSWKQDNSSLFRAKWRFLFTVFGAWIGAVVMPLDWDRPWQKWPVPCVISSFIFYFAINNIFCLYFLYLHLIARQEKQFAYPVRGAGIKSPSKSKNK